jgi:hypothetical protein
MGVGGQNLLTDRRGEFVDSAESERTIFVKRIRQAELSILRARPRSVEPLHGTLQCFWKLRSAVSSHACPRVRERVAVVMLAAMIAFGVSAVAQAQANLSGEYELKAAFLFNFAKFIDWPAGTFASPMSPFTICVLGVDSFGHALEDNLQGKMIRDQPIAVRRLKDKAEARHCQVVFVSSSETGHLAEIIESLQGANVLLVGDTVGFASSGGMIEFTLEDKHIRFTINTDAAERADLKFSAKLLALAKLVHDQGHSKGG